MSKTVSARAVLSCFACGYQDSTLSADLHEGNANSSNHYLHDDTTTTTTSGTMKRVSTSRRSDSNFQSPSMRSRSLEPPHREESDINEAEFADSLTFDGIDDDDNEQERLDRPRANSGHRRAMSDPYDAQENQDDDFNDAIDGEDYDGTTAAVDTFETNGSPNSHGKTLTTLPRYPVAETRDKNCWSEPPISIFSVRGANYFVSKKKVQSGPYLLRARGCDLFLNNKEDKSIAIEQKYVSGTQFVLCLGI
jgi:Protein ENHANCED DISEASE RESISTANCE 2, C-terminal